MKEKNVMFEPPRLAVPRLARVFQNRSPCAASLLSPCHALLAWGSRVPGAELNLCTPFDSLCCLATTPLPPPVPSSVSPQPPFRAAVPALGLALQPGVVISRSRVDGAPSTLRGGRTGLTAGGLVELQKPTGGRGPRRNRASLGAGLEKEVVTVPRVPWPWRKGLWVCLSQAEEPLGHKLPLPLSPFPVTSVKLKVPTD